MMDDKVVNMWLPVSDVFTPSRYGYKSPAAAAAALDVFSGA